MQIYHSKEQGFSTIDLALLVALVALLGFSTWTAWQSQRQASLEPAPSPAATYTYIGDALLKPYSVPAGWYGLECDSSLYLLVPGHTANTCTDPINEPANPNSMDYSYISVIGSNSAHLDPQSCANTLKLRVNSNHRFPADAYTCTDVVVDGNRGIRQTGTETTQSTASNGVPSVTTYYNFPAGDGNVLELSYTHYTQSPYPDLAGTFDQFVSDLEFK